MILKVCKKEGNINRQKEVTFHPDTSFLQDLQEDKQDISWEMLNGIVHVNF